MDDRLYPVVEATQDIGGHIRGHGKSRVDFGKALIASHANFSPLSQSRDRLASFNQETLLAPQLLGFPTLRA